MEIDLTPDQHDFVRRAVESGRFERAEDAVHEASTLWVERARRRAEILAAIDTAQASIARGKGIEITQESMRVLAEEIKRQSRLRAAAETLTAK